MTGDDAQLRRPPTRELRLTDLSPEELQKASNTGVGKTAKGCLKIERTKLSKQKANERENGCGKTNVEAFSLTENA